MFEERCERSGLRRGDRRRRVGVAALVALAMSLGRAPDVAAELIPFKEPFVYTEAAAPFSTAPEVQRLDATMAPGFPTDPLVARSAYSISSDTGNLAFAQALASSDGARGFSAAAFGISASWSSRNPTGRARSAMAFVATSPLGEGRVKAILEFAAAVTASGQLTGAERSFASFWVQAGVWDDLGLADATPFGLQMIEAPTVATPVVIGAAGFHQQLPGRNESRVTIYANDIPVETKTGNGPVVLRKRIVMNVPAGVLQVVSMGVTAIGNAVAYLDPVILPHPDNPDVTITLHGAHDPTSPRIVFPKEELAAVGVDLGPLDELGVLDPVEPPCTGGSAIAAARLDVRSVAEESSKLRFRGVIALAPEPLDPPFDPIARGARVLLTDSAGETILDDTVPGGAFDAATSVGWRHEPGGKRWVYTHPGRHGIRRLVLKRVAGAASTYRFVATAYLPTSPVPASDRLPLTATFVVAAPVASDGQCGVATFGAAPPAVRCPVQDGSRLVCR